MFVGAVSNRIVFTGGDLKIKKLVINGATFSNPTKIATLVQSPTVVASTSSLGLEAPTLTVVGYSFGTDINSIQIVLSSGKTQGTDFRIKSCVGCSVCNGQQCQPTTMILELMSGGKSWGSNAGALYMDSMSVKGRLLFSQPSQPTFGAPLYDFLILMMRKSIQYIIRKLNSC